MWGETKLMRILLGVAFTCRLIFSLRFSYLHPDEHLQGLQEIANGCFGWASQSPWEFQTDQPLRSFVPLWLVYGIPMGIFNSDSDPVYVLYTMRLIFAVLTWVLEDMAVDRLANTRNDKIRCLFFVSTSYVTLTWQAHTLSNSLETILVLWFLVILHEAQSLSSAPFQSAFDRHYDSVLAAFIIGLGVFNRPTFIAFLLLPSLSLLKFWIRFPATLLTFVMSLTVICGAFIYIDTLLYGSNTWVCTPWNFFKYNIQSANLDNHGTHSRLTHLFVNIPQLLGPGLLLLRPKWSSLHVQTIICGLALLSLFPHQEARFLIPLVPIFCSQLDFDHFKNISVRRGLLYTWIAFNAFMGIIMGVLHQAGVIPAQVQVREFDRPATVVWWKTYTPPLWVMGLQSDKVRYTELSIFGNDINGAKKFLTDGVWQESILGSDKMSVLDLQGCDIQTLREMLSIGKNNSKDLYLVAPMSKLDALNTVIDTSAPIWKTLLHLDPDLIDIKHPSTLKLGLGIWKVIDLL